MTGRCDTHPGVNWSHSRQVASWVDSKLWQLQALPEVMGALPEKGLEEGGEGTWEGLGWLLACLVGEPRRGQMVADDNIEMAWRGDDIKRRIWAHKGQTHKGLSALCPTQQWVVADIRPPFGPVFAWPLFAYSHHSPLQNMQILHICRVGSCAFPLFKLSGGHCFWWCRPDQKLRAYNLWKWTWFGHGWRWRDSCYSGEVHPFMLLSISTVVNTLQTDSLHLIITWAEHEIVRPTSKIK